MIRRSSLSLAVLAAAAPLAALASETFLGLAPCALCLWQRWPYWVAVLLALLAGLLRSRGLLVLAALAVLVSGALHRMQAKRFADPRHRLFDTEQEARAWLFED